jgi:hypothetical protein
LPIAYANTYPHAHANAHAYAEACPNTEASFNFGGATYSTSSFNTTA